VMFLSIMLKKKDDVLLCILTDSRNKNSSRGRGRRKRSIFLGRGKFVSPGMVVSHKKHGLGTLLGGRLGGTVLFCPLGES